MEEGKAQGKGIYYWNDGAQFMGQWRKDEAEGKGKYFYLNGSKYEGD